jgi:hypothetical protein
MLWLCGLKMFRGVALHDLAKSPKSHVTRKGGEGFGIQRGDIKCILSTELANVELSEKHDSNSALEARILKNYTIRMVHNRKAFRIRTASLDGRCFCLDCPLLVQRSMLRGYLLLDLVHIQVGDLSVLAIEDLAELLESWASGLNVEEVDECEFDEDPDGVECDEAVLWVDVCPGDGVGLVAEYQCSLDSQVHDHESLGSQLIGENLKRVRDEKT